MQSQAVVVGWQLFSITKDPLSLGLIGLTEAFPAIGVAIFAGYLADKIDRRKILLSAYLILLIAAIILALYTWNFEASYQQYGTMPIYAAIFFTGLARGFASPAAFALLTQLVKKDLYLNATTWNSSVWQLGAISGPAIGGFLYAIDGGPMLSYIVTMLLLALGFIALLFIKPKGIPPSLQTEPLGEKLLMGIKFVFANKTILSAISLDLFAVLFGGAVALLPVFADEILHVGPDGLGLLRSASAIGSTVMAIFIAHRPPMKNAGRNMLLAVAAFGLCMIGFALSTNFVLSFIFLLLSGAFDNISVVIRSTILQLLTPDEMRGRVSSVNSMFIGSSNEIGAFESGVTARLMGTVNSVLFGGSMTLIVVAVAWFKGKSLHDLDLKKMASS